MHFGFTLELSNVDLLNIDLLDTHLDLLDTDIPSKYFAFPHNVFKTSSRHFFKTSSRYVFKTSSRHVFKTSSRPTNVCWEESFPSLFFCFLIKNLFFVLIDILLVVVLLLVSRFDDLF